MNLCIIREARGHGSCGLGSRGILVLMAETATRSWEAEVPPSGPMSGHVAGGPRPPLARPARPPLHDGDAPRPAAGPRPDVDACHPPLMGLGPNCCYAGSFHFIICVQNPPPPCVTVCVSHQRTVPKSSKHPRGGERVGKRQE